MASHATTSNAASACQARQQRLIPNWDRHLNNNANLHGLALLLKNSWWTGPESDHRDKDVQSSRRVHDDESYSALTRYLHWPVCASLVRLGNLKAVFLIDAIFLRLHTFFQDQAGVGEPGHGVRLPALPDDFETP